VPGSQTDVVPAATQSGRLAGCLSELGAAVGAMLGWLVWTTSLGFVFLIAAPLVRGIPLGTGPVGRGFYLAGAAVVALWPLLVTSWPRFERWTWIWGLGMATWGVVIGWLAAFGLVQDEPPAGESWFNPHLTLVDVAIYQVVFLAALLGWGVLRRWRSAR
jgi:hypothetical protein